MSSNKLLSIIAAAATLAVAGLTGCNTPEPKDPKRFLPGKPQYHNNALGFSLRYPGVLNLKVKDSTDAGRSSVSLRIIYPGNEQVMFRLATYDPALGGHTRQYMVSGSERVQPVGGKTGARFLVEDQGSDDPGATLQHVTVVHDGTLFVMTGKGDTFEGVLESFEFIKPRSAPAASAAGGT